MKCEAFERWLNDGMPRDDAAHRHAEQCRVCADRLRSAEALDAMLDVGTAPPVAPPATLPDTVMHRIAAIEAARPNLNTGQAGDAFPWWVRVASQPSVVGALTLCAVVMWQSAALLSAGQRFVQWVGAAGTQTLSGALTRVDASHPALVAAALGIAVLPGMVWLSRVTYRWSWRLIEHAAVTHSGRPFAGR